MTGWDKLHGAGSYVTTNEPSGIVRDFAGRIPAHSRIADLGCGNGRNAVFLASQGHPVEACDIVEVAEWHQKLPAPLASLISFEERQVEDIALAAETYGAVVATRLIQYLAGSAMERLVVQSADALTPGGLLLLSYTTHGGIHDKPETGVQTFNHPVGEVLGLMIAEGLELIYRHEGEVPPQNVTIDFETVYACDLVVQKPGAHDVQGATIKL